jgi:hypothetical protein
MKYLFIGIWKGLLYIFSVLIMFAICFAISYVMSNWNTMNQPTICLAITALIASFISFVHFVFSIIKV